MTLSVRRLDPKEFLGDFDCGTAALNDYLAKYARESVKRQWNATWLAVDPQGAFAGYVTIVPGSVRSALLKPLVPRLPGYPAPVILLAKMGTGLSFRGQRVGSLLMREVFRAAVAQAEAYGCVGVFTHAKAAADGQASAVGFYEKFGFVSVEAPATEGDTTGMVLTMDQVRARLLLLDDALPP